MNCQSFAETISELARERNADQIEPTWRAQALDHLNECSVCCLKLQDERCLTRSLREMTTEMRSLEAPGRVEEQLLASFRQTNQKSEVRDQWSGIAGHWMVAVAAVLLVMFGVAGLGWYLRKSSGSREVLNALVENSPKPSPAIVEAPLVSPPAKPKQQLPVIVRRTNHRRPASQFNRSVNTMAAAPANEATNYAEREIATHFMPLGYAGPINPQDGGQLVRVELPRSAMLSMGLPVNMDRYGERVKADVLLGPDGLARAIRFVQ